MNNQKISILGTGWLGMPLAAHLQKKGYTIKGSTTSPLKIQQLIDLNIQPYLIQIDEKGIGKNNDDFFDADILIITIPPVRNIERFLMIIQTATFFIQKYQIPNVIYTSSTGVYGNIAGLVDETFPLQPQRVSSEAIVKAEQVLQNLTANVTILRLAGLSGGDRKAGRFLAGRKDVPQGNAPVNMLHQMDGVYVIAAIISGNHWNEIYNVCADFHPSRSDFYRAQAQKQGLQPPSFALDQNRKSSYKTIDNSKLKKDLNYAFIYNDPMFF